MRGAYAFRMMDLLTSDGGLVILTALGIAATAVSIMRDARAQKARAVAVTEDIPVDYRRAA
jgi:hypothetical protein